jgi:hypothetical protein
MHVKRLYRRPFGCGSRRMSGTYAGVIEKIPYLQSLGITAVELLPVQQFDEQEVSRLNPLTGEPLKNLLGVRAGGLVRPPPGLCVQQRPAPRGRRVPRYGQGAPPRRNRGHPGRGVQPHRRERPHRPDHLLSRPGEPGLLHAQIGPPLLPELFRHRQHGELQPVRRASYDPALFAALGAPIFT